MKIYRNIYFEGSSINVGQGSEDLYYTGRIYNNASKIKDFKIKYDESKDLYIICGSCAEKRYRKLIKK